MSVPEAIENVVTLPLQVGKEIVNPIVETSKSLTTGLVRDTPDWKSQTFLWFAIILFLILFIWAWVSYDPDQRIFTLYNIVEGGTYDFPRFSGQILIHDNDQGGVTEWLVGGGVAEIVGCSAGCADESDPSSGTLTYNSAINGYRWTQTKYTDPTSYTFITNRIVKRAL
jgi:hypothetical protein